MHLFSLLLCLGLASAAVPEAPAPDSTSDREIYHDASAFGPFESILATLARHQIQLVGGRVPRARIVIRKSRYMLTLLSGDRVLKTYKIQLGPEPHGAKAAMADLRTPEGSYRICAHNPHSQYYRSMQINYPGEADIRRGLADGTITTAQARELRHSLAACGCPSGLTPLGGSIFLHGQHPKRTEALRVENAAGRRDLGWSPGTSIRPPRNRP